LPIDAFACRADIISELFLRNVDLIAEVLAESQEAPGEPDRQRQQGRLFEAVGHPAQALAKEFDDANGNLRVFVEEYQEIRALQKKKLACFCGHGIGRASLSVEKCNFAKEVAGTEHVENETLTGICRCFYADLAKQDAIEPIPSIAFDEQLLSSRELAYPAKRSKPLNRRVLEPFEKGIEPQQLGKVDRVDQGVIPASRQDDITKGEPCFVPSGDLF
jgi:hypothetical protein